MKDDLEDKLNQSDFTVEEWFNKELGKSFEHVQPKEDEELVALQEKLFLENLNNVEKYKFLNVPPTVLKKMNRDEMSDKDKKCLDEALRWWNVSQSNKINTT